MRITLCGKRRQLGEKLFAAMGVDTLDGTQLSKGARYFHVQ